MLIAQAACRLGKEGFKGKGRGVGILEVFSDHPNLILIVFSRHCRAFNLLYLELPWNLDPYSGIHKRTAKFWCLFRHRRPCPHGIFHPACPKDIPCKGSKKIAI